MSQKGPVVAQFAPPPYELRSHRFTGARRQQGPPKAFTSDHICADALARSPLRCIAMIPKRLEKTGDFLPRDRLKQIVLAVIMIEEGGIADAGFRSDLAQRYLLEGPGLDQPEQSRLQGLP